MKEKNIFIFLYSIEKKLRNIFKRALKCLTKDTDEKKTFFFIDNNHNKELNLSRLNKEGLQL